MKLKTRKNGRLRSGCSRASRHFKAYEIHAFPYASTDQIHFRKTTRKGKSHCTKLLQAIKLGLPINIILVDNCGFGCIHRLQSGKGIEPDFGCLLDHGVDFLMNAKSLGIEITRKCSVKQGMDTATDNLYTAIMEECSDPKKKGKCKMFLIETDPDVTSPGYSWWDVKPPAVSSSKKIQDASKEYVAFLGKNREAKL